MLRTQLTDGDLLRRLHANFNRLEQDDYLPATLYERDAAGGWPGDTVGRTLLAWASLAQATGRAPKYLARTLSLLPAHLNEQGYLGSISDALDEQQFSGHGWLVSGLLECHKLSGDAGLLDHAQRMTNALFLQARGRMDTYPRDPAARIVSGAPAGTRVTTLGGWTISSDTGCIFITLEGLVRAWALSRDAAQKALIDEMFETYCQTDLLGISAQLHASLTAARQFLAYHDLNSQPALLARAREVYGWFRDGAITENYANYNWFNRPTWTEPCAVVDAFIVALQLWRRTGEAGYLDDAHHIYYNALGYAQKPHGGFGLENCAGTGEEPCELHNHTYDVPWCCNMRGAVGLSYAAHMACLADEPAGAPRLTLPFYFNSRVDVALGSGQLRMEQTTGYPRAGWTRLQIIGSTAQQPVTLRLYLPAWAPAGSARLTVNGQIEAFSAGAGFATFTRAFAIGDEIDFTFPLEERTEGLVNPRHTGNYHSIRRGPLMLGRTPAGNMAPLNDVIGLSEEDARSDRRQILFA
jgi:uncharacterized protein